MSSAVSHLTTHNSHPVPLAAWDSRPETIAVTATEPQWLYQFLPGPRPELATEPEAWTDDDERIAGDHFAYLRQALADELLILAGRSQDGIGPAIVVFKAPDEATALAFMNNDPFVSSNLFEASLHPYVAALIRLP